MKRSRDPLRGLRNPVPPPGLRSTILAAAERARAAGVAAPVQPGLIDRLWESRPLRWAWLVAVAALVAGHLALGAAPRTAVAGRAEEEPAEPAALAAAVESDGGGTLGGWSRQPSRHAALLIDLERNLRGDLR